MAILVPPSYLLKCSQQYVRMAQVLCNDTREIFTWTSSSITECKHPSSPSPSSTTACTTMGKISLSTSKRSWEGKKNISELIPEDPRWSIWYSIGEQKAAPYLFVSPFAEVDGVRGQTELLAHPPLEMHRLRLQRAVLGQVTAGKTWRNNRWVVHQYDPSTFIIWKMKGKSVRL